MTQSGHRAENKTYMNSHSKAFTVHWTKIVVVGVVSIAELSALTKGELMKTRYTVALSMLAGAALGAAAIQGLHAQAKPPVYVVSEITVSNVEGYTKEYVPLARAAIKNSGGKLLAASQNVTSLEGAPQKSRVTINVYDSLEKAQASRNAADYKAARIVGDKYATFRAFVVEGQPQ